MWSSLQSWLTAHARKIRNWFYLNVLLLASFLAFEICHPSRSMNGRWSFYDESKALCRFVWEIFAGFNFIDGDRGYDIIEKMINDI